MPTNLNFANINSLLQETTKELLSSNSILEIASWSSGSWLKESTVIMEKASLLEDTKRTFSFHETLYKYNYTGWKNYGQNVTGSNAANLFWWLWKT